MMRRLEERPVSIGVEIGHPPPGATTASLGRLRWGTPRRCTSCAQLERSSPISLPSQPCSWASTPTTSTMCGSRSSAKRTTDYLTSRARTHHGPKVELYPSPSPTVTSNPLAAFGRTTGGSHRCGSGRSTAANPLIRMSPQPGLLRHRSKERRHRTKHCDGTSASVVCETHPTSGDSVPVDQPYVAHIGHPESARREVVRLEDPTTPWGLPR